MVLITYDKISPYTGAALQEYSRTRNKDVEAMCDLAMYNYIEVFCQFYISDTWLQQSASFCFYHISASFVPHH